MKIPFKFKNRIIIHGAGILSVLCLMLFLFVSCEKENNPSDYNPPADHTISKDGFMHRSGLNQPLDNCVTCHGADLKGGTAGVSCYQCHGVKW